MTDTKSPWADAPELPLADNTAAAFIILPDLGLIKKITQDDQRDDKTQANTEKLLNHYREGRAVIVNLPNGDRLFVSSKGIGRVQGSEAQQTRAETMGSFAVLRERTSIPDGETSFSVNVDKTPDAVIAEITGGGLLLGPLPEGETDKTVLTAPVSTIEYLSGIIAWGQTPLAFLGRALARDGDGAIGDRGNGGQGSSPLAFIKALIGLDNRAVDRDDLTDEDLEDCGCDECEMELERRAVKRAGGSTALN